MTTDRPNLNLTTDENAIPYERMENSPRIRASYDGATAVEEIIIETDNLKLLVQECLPEKFKTAGSGRRLPGAEFFRAVSVDSLPFTGFRPSDPFDGINSAKPASFDGYTRVIIEYACTITGKDESTDGRDPSTYLEQRLGVGGEFLAINPEKTEIGEQQLGGGVPSQLESQTDRLTPQTKVIPNVDMSMRWTEYPDVPPWATWIALLGTVNNEQTDIFFNFEAETVLFMGFEAEPKYIWCGGDDRLKVWDIDFRFTGRRIADSDGTYGWNHIWSPRKKKWVKLVRDGKLLYEVSALDDIFDLSPFAA